MKFTEIVNRLNGLSCPIFGASWTPPVLDVTVARRVIRFLEDRRVLYSPYAWEEPGHCVQSVLEIRRFLTTELGNAKPESELIPHLKAIRAACRKFLDEMHLDQGRRVRLHDGMEPFGFYSALARLPQFRSAVDFFAPSRRADFTENRTAFVCFHRRSSATGASAAQSRV